MNHHFKAVKSHAAFAFSLLLATSSALAEPVWHCSRSDVQIADASDSFTLAALSNSEREVIRISLRDLHTVYQGSPVRMNGGQALSACVVGEDSDLTITALKSIGANPTAIRGILRQSSINKSNIYKVADESAMLSCISNHHPAIGYLPKTTHTESVGPCF